MVNYSGIVLATFPNGWQAFVLGMVQGLTEFLPISSTAHLRIVPALLGWPDPGASFSAVIQLGSLLAILIYFAKDLSLLLQAGWKAISQGQQDTEEVKILTGILVGSLPIIIAGGAIKVIWESPPRDLTVIALASIGLALGLASAERWGKRQRDWSTLTVQDGIWIGVAQALALIPGVSRSGATITAGLFLALNRETAARFAFLLGIPALALAGLVEFVSDFEWSGLGIQGIGTLAAFVFSYGSIDWLLKFLQQSSTQVFILYRIGLGIFILLGVKFDFLQ
jgi:undecaprenyl-diphosphatase